MILFRIGYVQSFEKTESQAINRLCNIIETRHKKVNSRDLKIIILAVHRLWFDWMKLVAVNVRCKDLEKREFGFFYQNKYYINALEDIKGLNKAFLIFLDNKRLHDTKDRTKRNQAEQKRGTKRTT